MMERHLHTEAAWSAWLEVLASHPERAAEIDARASLLYEQRGCLPALLPATMVEAAHIERTLDLPFAPAPRRAALARRIAPVAMAAAIALVAGWGVQRSFTPDPLPAETAMLRAGAGVTDLGSLRVEQARVTLARVAVGRGVRPRLVVTDGPLTLRWSAPAGREAVAWFVAAEAAPASPAAPSALPAAAPLAPPVSLAAVTELPVPPGAVSLVVAVLPAGAAPGAAALAARIGDARADVEPLGDISIVAFDLVRAR